MTLAKKTHGKTKSGKSNFLAYLIPQLLSAGLSVTLIDPHGDLAWMCVRAWRFGHDTLPVGGIGEREPFYRA